MTIKKVAPWDPTTESLDSYPTVRSEWREIEEFDATLTLVGQERGRSAAHFVWREEGTNRRFSMFMTDLSLLILNFGVPKGAIVKGRWTVQKRGQNYGVRRVA